MKPLQLIIIGAFIVFGPPIALGAIVGRLHGWLDGLIAGALLLVLSIALIHKVIMKRAKKDDTPNKTEL